MSRKKLEALGLNLPLYPTTSVGSFAKPPELAKARAAFARKEITEAQLREAADRATTFWVQKQEELGVDILVDGEMDRGDMVEFFADLMGGFTKGGWVRSYGNRYYHKPIVTGPVAWEGPMTVDRWRFAQKLTHKPVKGMLTGAYTIMDWSFDEHYPDRRACTLAIARELRKEVAALVGAGAKIIQIDEPALSVRPHEVGLVAEAMRLSTEGLNAYFVTHVCYGDFDRVYPAMLDIPVDNFDLEMANSGLDLLHALERSPFRGDLSLGVVDVHSHEIESSAVAAERIRKVRAVVAPENIWIDPDCGLKTRTVQESIEKMRVVVEAAKAARAG